MYSFLLARVLPEKDYKFFTYQGEKPVTVDFRGTPTKIEKGTRFGVRMSTNGKHYRLIFPTEPTRVYTIDQVTADKLRKGLGK